MPSLPEIVLERVASDGVRKYLVALSDGAQIETVLIPGLKRTTLCISTQVGCPVACTFCATGRMGLVRDLSSEEIVSQYELARGRVAAQPDIAPEPLENIVYMGMGEPFLNYKAVTESLDRFINDHGFHSKIITVSTIGIADRIAEFGRAYPHVRLAVSLHASTDERREAMIPINRRWPIVCILDACRDYTEITGRKIFFEYVLIEGENDTEDEGRRLGALLANIHATVNLIPVHPGGVGSQERPSSDRVEMFRAALKQKFMGHVTFRNSRGLDIEAACGQLATSV